MRINSAFRFILLFLCLLFCALQTRAQNDTEFWFAAPDNDQGNANNRDQPIYLRVATFSQPATITLSYPARPTVAPIVVEVPANGTYTFNLDKANTESQPSNTILNFGIKLTSTAPITAYYEQSSTSNPDIFTLKGKNALGTRFVVPSQFNYNNSTRFLSAGGAARNSFVIVAKENNTQVTIVPKNDIDGHAANTPFTITLNAGQTYSGRATGFEAAKHLGGTIITSNKPIAVTINDDSVEMTDLSGPDLAGDQLISHTIFGKEYCLVKGYYQTTAGTSTDRVYIFADSSNTAIIINGTLVATLTAGNYYNYTFGTDEAAYLTTSKPVIVYHLSGYNEQPAGAIIPPIQCTGSNEIVFTRSSVTGNGSQRFGLVIITKTGDESSFSVSPSDFTISASNFLPVPGTAGEWKYARMSNIQGVNTDVGYRVSNSSGLFHMGLLYGWSSSNARYGFYSNFSSVNLGPDVTICPGDSIYLDAGAGKDSYLWSTGETTHDIWAKLPGTYWVHVVHNLCQLNDTIQINNYTVTPINLGSDRSVCGNNTTTLNAGAGFLNYLWSTGQTSQSITVQAGTYSVQATNPGGCISRDTINVIQNPLPPPKQIKHF